MRTPSRSKTLSRSFGASAHSMWYARPEQPPPLTAMRRPAAGVCRSSSSFFSRSTALSPSKTPLPMGFAVVAGAAVTSLRPRASRPLLLEVLDRRLDRVFGEHRAVNLHGWQRELFRDLLVGDRAGLVDR